jgi:hypothetical protein
VVTRGGAWRTGRRGEAAWGEMGRVEEWWRLPLCGRGEVCAVAERLLCSWGALSGMCSQLLPRGIGCSPVLGLHLQAAAQLVSVRRRGAGATSMHSALL